MDWKIIKRETTPMVLGIAMCINFIISFFIAIQMGTALQKHGQSATLAVITGIIIFLVIGILLFWLSALIMDDGYEEEDALTSTEGELVILSGMYQGEHLKLLPKEKLMIGRNPNRSQLIFDSMAVSERHCQITYNKDNQTYEVTDYSQSGTYLSNGERLPGNQEIQLEKGSVIQIGYTDNFIQLE